MLKTVTVGSLAPNPFRRIKEYPIQREKVDALRESIQTTGFWGTIVGRSVNGKTEIAFGHHRLVALQEEYGSQKKVEVIVRKLSNEQMLQMMARENLEEWGTSAWVEMETVKAVVEAYTAGHVELPELPAKTKKSTLYAAPSFVADDPTEELDHPYTRAQVASLLGWTNTGSKGTDQPNRACEAAFRALELVERGYLKESQCRGLTREHLRVLVDGQWQIYQSHMRAAKVKEQQAAQVRKLAENEEDSRKRRALTTKAASLERQAERATSDAADKAKAFAQTATEGIRAGRLSVRDVREQPEKFKATQPKPEVVDVDGLVRKIENRIYGFANEDDDIAEWFSLLKQHLSDASESSLKSLDRELNGLSKRIERMRKALKLDS